MKYLKTGIAISVVIMGLDFILVEKSLEFIQYMVGSILIYLGCRIWWSKG